jgi:putative ABC transport system permease protein
MNLSEGLFVNIHVRPILNRLGFGTDNGYEETVMLRNYLKTALRNLRRNPLFTGLNIGGLALGLACCTLILLYVRDELSFDRFHEKADRIYRLESTFDIEDRTMNFATTAHVQGPMMKAEFPEVEDYVRMTRAGSRRIVEYNERAFEEDKWMFVDGSFFRVFSFELLAGDPATALNEPESVVITSDMAEKYFGTEDPAGKSLRVNKETLYKVTGVVQNIPQNSHFRPDFLASFSTLKLEPSGNIAADMVSNVDYYTYLLLNEGSDPTALEEKFAGYIDKYLTPLLKTLKGSAELSLEPLTRIYLYSKRDAQLERTGDIAYVYLFAGIGLFILLLAALNFMNLSTARSANRAREVGLRKTVGAARSRLARQFLGESLLLTFLALLLSWALVAASLGLFRSLSGKELSLRLLFEPGLLAGIAALFLAVGLLGGIYPALFLSAFKPVDVLQGRFKRGARSSWMRVVLVTFQFAVSIILIIGTLTVTRQLQYIRSKNLGYDMDHVVTFPVRNAESRKQLAALKQELRAIPSVLSVTASRDLPLGSSSYSAYHVEGKPREELNMFFSQVVDEDYIDTFRMELLEGRNFSKEFVTDADEGVIINQAGVRKLGWTEPLGKGIDFLQDIDSFKTYRVIGVVKDYHFQSLHDEIQPMLLFYSLPYAQTFSRVSVRVSPEDIQSTIARLEDTWKAFDPQYPFEFEFVDDRYDTLYRTEERLGRLFGVFTGLAIVIGCLGLFGLTSFVAEQRTKEIGIRKVLGASAVGMTSMLVRDFIKWVGLAVLFAWPVGYLVMRDWLQNFAYRIGLGVGIFLTAAVLALAIAVLTVSYQSVRAALADPIRSLRYE